ncbi:MAG: hypothetical protein ACI4JK_02225 [Oscillospiraceae bacterium]
MPFNIKVRITALGRYQNELIPELKKRDIITEPGQLCNVLKGRLQGQKADDILSAANEIVTEWEHEQRRTS